jgi:hypothetical protein
MTATPEAAAPQLAGRAAPWAQRLGRHERFLQALAVGLSSLKGAPTAARQSRLRGVRLDETSQ